MEKLLKTVATRVPFRVAVAFCASFLVFLSFYFLRPLYQFKFKFDHPEYVSYYYGFRHWMLQKLKQGQFPHWNPYWGIGNTTEIAASFPIDIYTLFELAIGPQYHLIQIAQMILLLFSVLWSLLRLGLPPLVATAGAGLFFFSPWVVYFFFYFIKTNSFIGFIVCFPLAYFWFEKRDKRSLFLFAVATVFSMFGTKLEFWFFHCVFYVLFGLTLLALQKRSGEKPSAKTLIWFLTALLAAVLTHTWQLVPLLQIMGQTHRLGDVHRWGYLISSELYSKLFFSVTNSRLLHCLLICGCLLGALRSTTKRRWGYLAAGIGLGIVFQSWRVAPFYFLASSYVYGAVAALVAVLYEDRRKGKDVVEAFLVFLPLAYYWLRPDPGDIGETYYLHSAPLSLKFISGVLVALGCLQWRRQRVVALAGALIIVLFLCRDQGLILLSYLTGALWIPTRDNFMFDFLLTVIAAVGLASFSHGKYRLVALVSLVLCVGFAQRDLRTFHPSMNPAPPGFTPPFTGEPNVISVLSRLRDSATWRGYFTEGYAGRYMYAPSLAAKAPQVARFSSLPDARFKDWVIFQNLAISPSEHWDGYLESFSAATLAKLPYKSDKGYAQDFIYWQSLSNNLTLQAGPLRFLGVRHIISEAPLPPSKDWTDLGSQGGFHVAALKDPVPRAFLVPVLPNGAHERFFAALSPTVSGRHISAGEIKTALTAVEITRYEDENIVIETDHSEVATLVLTDLFHPFWTATIDGKPASLFPAFHAFRAIAVPAGKHRIEYRCAIPFFTLGCFISFLMALVFVVVGLTLYLPRFAPLPARVLVP